ncbi:DNA-processing protein DprA [Candidatus Oleimmundimicrobium sp.]|uniref:DNA-processing protein DprA n=1 Tax=Candidatus Oleimmundimicrobium sp. TaxID=3060597 RepID=UPI0027245754|nr:DNA-processing protein DprA [Candidatus Oleimmundimicrobium sp.]MDO8885370.1 DNA-processing protein DprA [Candidatus Oleimmundimicrobium sp.]
MEKKYWLGLKLMPVLDSRVSKVIDYFGTAEEVWSAKSSDFLKIEGINLKVAEAIIKERAEVDLDFWWQKYKNLGIDILTIFDKDYPALLKEIHSPPPVLFFKGNLIKSYSQAVAVVGSRRASAYGRAFAEELASNLSEMGITVVSGVARGIDSAAHRGALRGKGSTIGVLGCGLDVVYPSENKLIYEAISKQGSLISEYRIKTKPLKWNFPARNRIISGLTRGIVVVEASEKSGALITADFALEQGREVFAVPGNPKNNLARGPHKLLKSGACLIESAEDIVEALGLNYVLTPKTKSVKELSEKEEKVLGYIGWDLKHIDEITRELGLSSSEAAIALTTLEIKGFVKHDIGKNYLRIS